MKSKKISIIGAGAIGTQAALYLQYSNIYCNNDIGEIVFYNHNSDLAIGEAADINDSIFFHHLFSSKKLKFYKIIPTNNIQDISDSDVIIIAVGTTTKTLQTKDRMVEMDYSYDIIKKIGLNIKKYSKNSFVIMITNPVDILTWYMQEISGLPINKVVGIGVALDSARYAYNLGEEFKKYKFEIDEVEALVIGAHSGEDMLMIDSQIKVNNKLIHKLDEKLISKNNIINILKQARRKTYDRGFFIGQQKRQRTASISPAAIASNLCLSYLKNETISLPLTRIVTIEDFKKYNNKIKEQVCIGVMTSVNAAGSKVIEIELDDFEQDKFYDISMKLINLKKQYDYIFNNKVIKILNHIDNEIIKYFFIEEKIIRYINVTYNKNILAHNDNLTS